MRALNGGTTISSFLEHQHHQQQQHHLQLQQQHHHQLQQQNQNDILTRHNDDGLINFINGNWGSIEEAILCSDRQDTRLV